MEISVQFNATLPIKITKKEKWVLASCPVLDVHSQGETEAKARNNLGEALSLFFASCFERGTLDAVLKRSGFRAVHTPFPPSERPMVSDKDYINVPIPFLVNETSPNECRA